MDSPPEHAQEIVEALIVRLLRKGALDTADIGAMSGAGAVSCREGGGMNRVLAIAAGVFLGIIALVLAVVLVSRPSSGWEISVSEDPITDALTATAAVHAENGRGGMQIACDAGEPLGVFIQSPIRLGGFLASENFQKRVITYRFDGGAPKKMVGVIGDDLIGLSEESGAIKGEMEEFLTGMEGASRMAVEAHGIGSGERSVMTFDISGAGPILQHLRKRCGLV